MMYCRAAPACSIVTVVSPTLTVEFAHVSPPPPGDPAPPPLFPHPAAAIVLMTAAATAQPTLRVVPMAHLRAHETHLGTESENSTGFPRGWRRDILGTRSWKAKWRSPAWPTSASAFTT